MHRLSTVIVAAVISSVSSSSAFAQYVQQGPKLVGTGAVLNSYQGLSVAMSGDGNTAIVGGPVDNNGVGAAWIYTRVNGVWTQAQPKLVAATLNFGTSVALSADGSTAVVGSVGSDSKSTAWIFVRSGSAWVQQGPKLAGNDGGSTNPAQSVAVAISADGNTILVGSYLDNLATGATWVFTRTGSTWSQQGPKLVGTGAIGPAGQGFRVALSADGNTALVGGNLDNGSQGAGWIFVRSGATWTQQAKVTGTGAVAAAPNFGLGVALSGDGNTAAIGAPDEGAVWVFSRSGSTWTQQGPKLTGVSTPSIARQGFSVALSHDGNRLLVGASGGPLTTGGTFAFSRFFSIWSQMGAPLVGTGAVGGADQGRSVGLSSDGRTAIEGGYIDNTTVGAAWVFAETAAVNDFDSDGRADATLTTTSGDWVFVKSKSGYTTSFSVQWAFPGSEPVRGDFDGDRVQDPALYDPLTGHWRVLKSGSNFTSSVDVVWGGPGDAAVPGDYDADGMTDPAVYNAATGVWRALKSSSGYAVSITVPFGGPGYTPIPGQDFDGDRASDPALYRASNGSWLFLTSSSGYTASRTVAWSNSIPVAFFREGVTLVPGDYDGDGKSDLGYYFHVNAGPGLLWFVRLSSDDYHTNLQLAWGGSGYAAVPGDYDGDGRFDVAVYQRSTGQYLVKSSATSYASAFAIDTSGFNNGTPLTSAIPVLGGDPARASDYDGDALTEITIYDTASGLWSSLLSNTGYTTASHVGWGGTGYIPVPGDYDGDGKGDIAVYRQSSGDWFVRLSSTRFTTVLGKNVGGPGWTPVPGDYDGDGATDFVSYNTTTGQWFGFKSGSGYSTTLNVSWGGTGYTPVRGDFDADGKTDIGVYATATGLWSVLLSSTNYTSNQTANVGGTGWIPVPGDYDFDNKTDFVVYNTSNGQWYGLTSTAGYVPSFNVTWGGSGYIPVRGDYDDDGRTDLAVYQPSTGAWYILQSTTSYRTVLTRTWGGSGYEAVPQFP